MNRRLSRLLVFGMPAALLLFPGSYALGAIALALVGLVCVADPACRHASGWRALAGFPACWGIAAYLLLNLVVLAVHREPASHFGALVPFVLFPLVLLAFARMRPDPAWFWSGSAVGALVALTIAVVQVYGLGVARAYGHNNPILFGDCAVLLGSAALVGWAYDRGPARTRPQQVLLLAGGAAGLLASLLSGSKGGWLSMLTVMLLVCHVATRHHPWRMRALAMALLLATLVSTIAVLPRSLVVDRITQAAAGALVWLQTGVVTEDSAAIRLASMQAGLQVGIDHWLVGAGAAGAAEGLQAAAAAGTVDPLVATYRVIDNDFIETFAAKGLPGVLALLAFHAAAFVGFYRHRHDHRQSVRAVAVMGMLLVIIMIEFGLSTSIFGRNIFRYTYIGWLALLCGLIWSAQRGADTAPAAH